MSTSPSRILSVLCVFLFLERRQAYAVPKPSNSLNDTWSDILKKMYNQVESSVGFCFGKRPEVIIQLIADSFHWPDLEEGVGVCSDAMAISRYLCGPKEVEVYYKFMLLSNDPEKVPSTKVCPAGSTSDFCSPGFFESDNSTLSCCPGFFCPRNLACMIPCPQGAYCPKGIESLPPKPFVSGRKTALWCAPYAYKKRPSLPCGGADKWSILPEAAFPGVEWLNGSGSMYCPAGNYCPNTTSQILCPRGYFCRQGSEQPKRCPPGSFCKSGTEVPLKNYGGFSADIMLLLIVTLLWIATWHYNEIARKLKSDERIQIVLKPWIKLQIVAKVSRRRQQVIDCREPRLSRRESLEPIDICFFHLNLRLRGGTHKVILSDVSARLVQSKLTAILGPSGAGKSSLLALLAGRAQYGKASGLVFVNGQLDALERYRHIMGFVPQDDLMYSELTVEENILFAARFGMARGTNWEDHKLAAMDTINLLGLEGVMHCIAGDERIRGISGGQVSMYLK